MIYSVRPEMSCLCPYNLKLGAKMLPGKSSLEPWPWISNSWVFGKLIVFLCAFFLVIQVHSKDGWCRETVCGECVQSLEKLFIPLEPSLLWHLRAKKTMWLTHTNCHMIVNWNGNESFFEHFKQIKTWCAFVFRSPASILSELRLPIAPLIAANVVGHCLANVWWTFLWIFETFNES